MNDNCRKSQNKKRWLLYFLLLLVFTSCSTIQLQKTQDKIVERDESQKNDILIKPNSSLKEITIKDAKVFCWWWDEFDVKKGVKTTDSKPTKYIELIKWEYDGERKKTYPHEVDFISQITNNSSIDFQGNIKFQLAAKFEDYEKLYFRDQKDDSIKFSTDEFEKLTWINEKIILEEDLIIPSNQERKVEMKNYSLVNQLNQKANGKPLCALRFTAQVFDVSGNFITSKEKIIHVLIGN